MMTVAPNAVWRCRDLTFDLAARPLIMGVLNVTPDSFSDGGSYRTVADAVARARAMAEEGADIIDIGGESSRPGAGPVPEEEELARVVPVIEALSGRVPAALSVDTVKGAVARAALAAGAHILNDISGGTADPVMTELAAEHQAGLVLMHMQGSPRTMQDRPRYTDVVTEVGDYLHQQVEAAAAAGVGREQMVVDPGIGFGKELDHNLDLLRGIPAIRRAAGRPVLIGVSRKRFIGAVTGRDVGDRLSGSLAAMCYALTRGASIIRVHDVKESCDAARMMAKLILIEDHS